MTDHLTKKARSINMSKIRSKNTSPEIALQRALKALKVRYLANLNKLPGKPDVMLKGSEVLIFVHGCFWHCCPLKTCRRSNMPKSNQGYWKPKLDRNKARDRENIKKLKKLGWKPYIIWECQARRTQKLKAKLLGILQKNNIGYIRLANEKYAQ